MAKPFLKWAGGKRQHLAQLRENMPAKFNRYFEPFVGGGALFFDLAPKRAVLNDMNARLMATYRAVRDDVSAVIGYLMNYRSQYQDAKTRGQGREFYERVRASDVDPLGPIAVAAWTIFLNRTCYNGLYRVNKAGKFNVPYGKYKNPTICDVDGLREASDALQRIHLRSGDFRFACTNAKEGDLVYFDPPYPPTSETADFTAYTPGGFGPDQHRALRDTALALKERGVHVMISNALHPAIKDLYARGFHLHQVVGRQNINSKGDRRGGVGEFIIT